jgi:hypothetical protein
MGRPVALMCRLFDSEQHIENKNPQNEESDMKKQVQVTFEGKR